MKTRSSFCFAVAALIVAACSSGMPEPTGDTEQPALGESVDAANTNFWWYYGQTGAQVSTLLSQNNARLVSLRVESSSPLLFDVAMVQNTGTNAKAWWWYPGLTEQQVHDYTNANNARIVNLEPYVINGVTYFAVVMEHNVGTDANAWWWYYGKSGSDLSALLTQHNARLVDWRQYWNGTANVYSAVMVQNSGASQTGWWWYPGITAAQITQYTAQNNAYLVSIDPADATGSTFNVVMNQFSPGFSWWWAAGKTAAEVTTLWHLRSQKLCRERHPLLRGSDARQQLERDPGGRGLLRYEPRVELGIERQHSGRRSGVVQCGRLV